MGVVRRHLLGLCVALAGAGALAAVPAMAAPKETPKAAHKLVHKAKHKTTHKAAPKTAHKAAQKTTPRHHVPLPQVRPAGHAAARAAGPIVRNVPLPRPHPQRPRADAAAHAPTKLASRGAMFASPATFKPIVRPVAGPFAIAPTTTTSAADIDEVKKVIAESRRGHDADANAAEQAIRDPVARLLAEWIILRSDNTSPSFQRYAAFVQAHPAWPHVPLFRRRAENALWNDGIDNDTILAFFAHHKPSTAKGRYMLARALLAKGDVDGATALVRYAWRYEDCSAGVEQKVLEMFGNIITREDHRVRMEARFYHDDVEAGMREAHRLGGSQLAIARARTAVIKRLNSAKKYLDDVPVAARQDPGYIFAKVQWLRKHDKPDEAERLLLTAPRNAAALVDTNQWWLELRVLVRALLDKHNAQAAYRVARDAAPPQQDNWRVDKYFTAGWIALRYLHDPKTAARHFAHIAGSTTNPYALGRAGYWQGRAAEAMGKRADARAFYKRAAKYTTTYYGQLARARLGIKDIGLTGPPALTAKERAALGNLEVVRAVKILYSLDERNMLASIYASIGKSATDIAGMAMLAEVAEKHGDARAMALIGRHAYARDLPMDYYAYPTVGLPSYRPISPWPIDKAVAYSIARTESNFNQQDVSSAHAVGLMQVTPEAGRDTARRFKVKYDFQRLRKDPVYNMQMGAAEVANGLHFYRGSFLLTFAGYNAGMGRVKQWIAAYGDPRDPKVDPIDWAERIPLAETRNYVQRVMENLQVYRARFGGGNKLLIEADLKRGAE
jgi:soluble lytic murein transglycosylase